MPTSKKNLYILAAGSLLLIIAAVYFLFVFQKGDQKPKVDRSAFEVKGIEEVEVSKRPFITMTPTATGAEIILSIENMAEFENIEYELTYLADNPQIPNEKIQRGSTGTDVDTKTQKYKKSILLGTASRGAASPDKGITDGKLTLHLFKGNIEYRSETPWYLIESGLSNTTVSTPNEELSIKMPKLTKDYFMIILDTVGIPPNPQFETSAVQLPSYGVFSIAPKFSPKAQLSIKTQAQSAKIFSYNQEATWGNIDSTVSNGTVLAEIENLAAFVVVKE